MTEQLPQKIEAPADALAAVEAGEKPLTAEQFTESLHRLVERGKEAGLKPARIMLATYLKKATDAVEGFLGGLEGRK